MASPYVPATEQLVVEVFVRSLDRASEDRSRLLWSCHVEALRVADALECATIAFPAISTGVYGYPLDLAAPVAIGAVQKARTGVQEVRFVLFDRPAYVAFERTLSEVGR